MNIDRYKLITSKTECEIDIIEFESNIFGIESNLRRDKTLFVVVVNSLKGF